jgi:hypothetical protein
MAGRRELHSFALSLSKVGKIYKETHAALCSELPILAGIGIRAIIEAVCKDKKIKGRNLEEKIDALVAKGLTTPAGAKILHSLRFLGNDAAHEVKAHSTEELASALSVAEHLLQSVYILPGIAKALPKRA